MQNIDIVELGNNAFSSSDHMRENIANKYIQDLYRFFNLFRRKGEFRNPFATPVNLVIIPVLSSVFDDNDTLRLVAEFYFKRGYYNDALELFMLLSDRIPPSADIYQKTGYCYQKIGDIEHALEHYERSELIDSSNLWTLRRIAACHKLLGNYRQALEYFERVAERSSNDINVTMNMGYCEMQLGNYENALKHYYKVEFLEENSTRALRLIAWCLLLSGNYDRCSMYYDRIAKDDVTAVDYLNMGHVAIITGQYNEAVRKYVKSKELYDRDNVSFETVLKEDENVLLNAGVEQIIIDLVIDKVLQHA